MAQDLQKGTELADRYTLVRKLGASADTETWLASDRMTRASVALKILNSQRISAAMLRQEWQTSLRLMHPHIARVFEFHDTADGTFFSLQYIAGSEIGALSGAPLAHVLPPLALVADALRYTHAKGIVHRDIKPSNILLDQNGAPYLTDFGAASLSGSEVTGGSLIAASPQSLAGDSAQPADDIFALGGLIYELVSGRSPYSSATTSDDIRKIVPPLLNAASADAVPQAVQQLVARMLDKDASERPDAQAVFDALASAGFAAGPTSAAYSAERQTSTPEIIEASDAIHPTKVSGPVAATATDKSGSGISPRTMGISLLVLVAVLIGVVFILPNTISTGPDEPTAAGEQAPGSGQAIEDTAADADGDDRPGRDARVVARDETDEVLGQLLSRMDTLERRAVQRWGGLRYKQAQEVYEQGDAAYLARNYATASDKYLEAIEIVDPLLDEVDGVFATTFANAQAALEVPDSVEALRLFELAVAISPSHAAANAGYQRARNLDTVLSLTDSGFAFEKSLELEAARQSFERAVEIDPEWLPAQTGLLRVQETIRQMEFDLRMTEGLYALSDGHFDAARAAFRMAQKLKPGSPEPADGLLQVDQGIRLNRITEFEQLALQQQENEQWETVVTTYQGILEIDGNLEFAQRGLAKARQMTALYEQLDKYIEDPDRLSTPSIMQKATTMVVNITRMPEIGPRLGDKRDELARLLKRAATPLTVQLISDNVTSVSIYKVGKLGSFATRELSLRPGTYVAVGSRPGYRDVRLEFLVGPELEPKPVVIRCEEAI